MSLRNSIRKWFQRRPAAPICKRPVAKERKVRLLLERLEDRLAPAAISDNGAGHTLTFVLSAHETVSIVANANTYAFTTTGSNTFTNAGVTTTGDFSAFGTSSITWNSHNPTTDFATLSFNDHAGANAGAAITFSDSMGNGYTRNFTVDLTNASAGDITFNGASSFAGTAALTASTTGAVTIASAATLTQAAGTLSLTAGGNLTAPVDAGTAQITAPTIILVGATIGTSPTDRVEVKATTKLNATTTDGNMFLGNVSPLALGSLNAGAGFIDLEVAGALTDGNGGAGAANLIAANGVNLTTTGSNSAIGTSALPIRTAIGALTATTNDGGVYISDSNGPGLIIASILAQQGGYAPVLNKSNQVVVNGNSGTDNVAVTATGPIEFFNAPTVITTVAAPKAVTITSTGGSVVEGQAGSVNVLAQTVTLTANGAIGVLGGAIGLMVPNLSAGTTNGSIFLTEGIPGTAVSVVAGGAGNNVSVTGSGATLGIGTITAPGTVTVDESEGPLVSGTSMNVTGQTVNLTGKSGIGSSSSPFTVTAANVSATTSTLRAAIFVNNTTGLSSVSATTNAGDTTINYSGGSLQFAASMALLAAAGSATVSFDNTGGNVELGVVTAASITASGAIIAASNVNVTGGAVTLTAGTGIGATGSPIDTNVTSLDATTTSGDIVIVQAAHPVTVSATSEGFTNPATLTGSDIHVQATTGNLTVGTISALGTVTLTTGGALSAPNGSAVSLTADTLTLTAADGIGTSGAVVMTSANTLSADGGAGGGLFVSNNQSLKVTSASASGGAVSITTLVDLYVGSVTAAGQAVTLSAGGALIDPSGPALNVTAQSATLSGASIGGPGDPLETRVSSITATATGAGLYISDLGTGSLTLTASAAGVGSDIDFTSAGSIVLTTITAQGNTVTLTAAGSITTVIPEPTVNITAQTLDLVAPGGIGTSGDPLEVIVGQVAAADGGTPGVFMENAGALSITQEALEAPGNGTLTFDAGSITIEDMGGSTAQLAPGRSLLLRTQTGPIVFLNPADTIETSNGGTITVEAGAIPGSGGVAVIGNLTTQNNSITVTADGDITIGLFNAGTGHVTVQSADGIILKGNGPSQVNIIAGSATLSGHAPTARQLQLNEENDISSAAAASAQAGALKTLDEALGGEVPIAIAEVVASVAGVAAELAAAAFEEGVLSALVGALQSAPALATVGADVGEISDLVKAVNEIPPDVLAQFLGEEEADKDMGDISDLVKAANALSPEVLAQFGIGGLLSTEEALVGGDAIATDAAGIAEDVTNPIAGAAQAIPITGDFGAEEVDADLVDVTEALQLLYDDANFAEEATAVEASQDEGSFAGTSATLFAELVGLGVAAAALQADIEADGIAKAGADDALLQSETAAIVSTQAIAATDQANVIGSPTAPIVLQVSGTIDVTAGPTDSYLEVAGTISVNQIQTEGSVTLVSTGAITAGSGVPNVLATGLNVSAAGGIGTAANPLVTSVGTLNATNTTSGNIEISNTAPTPAGLNVTGISNTGGKVSITEGSPLTVSGNITSAAAISLTAAAESLPATGDDLTVNSGVTIQSTGSSVALVAGDNVVIPFGATIEAGSTITITANANDDPAGENVTVAGTLSATSASIGVDSGAHGNETFNITPSALTPIAVDGGSGTTNNTLNFDADGLAVTISGNRITAAGRQTVTFSHIQFLHVINAAGGGGITLNASAGMNDALVLTGTGPGAGTFTLNGGTSISFSGVDSFAYNGGSMTEAITVSPYGTPLTQWGVAVALDGGTGASTLTYNAVAGLSDNLTIQPSAPLAGQLSDSNAGTDAAIAVVTYAHTNNLDLNGSSAGGANDILTVNGTMGTDTVTIAPLTVNSATITGVGPMITATGMGQIAYNGQGGNDALTVASPAATTVTLTPGAAVDSGTVQMGTAATLIPLSYTTLGTTGSLTVANTGGTRVDTLVDNGTAGDDAFTIESAGAGEVVLNNQIDVLTPGVSALTLNGLTGVDTYSIASTLPYTKTNVNGSGGAIVNLSGAMGAVTVNLPDNTPGSANPNTTITGYGGTVTLIGVGTANMDANGNGLLVNGTSLSGNTTYTPMGASAGTFSNAGLATVFNFVGESSLVLNGSSGAGANNTLTVNGTTGTDTVTIAPLTANSATITGAGPMITATGMGQIAYNGQGGNDTLIVTSPAATVVTLTPGAAVDSGTVQMGTAATLVPLGYSNLGTAGALTVANTGGTRVDTLVYNGAAANDTFTVDAGTGTVHLNSQIPVLAPGVNLLTLNGLAGDNTYTISASAGHLQPYTTIAVNGSGTSDPDVLNLNGDGSAITANLGGTSASTVGGGLGTVAISGVGVVNLNDGVGAVTISGTSLPDAFTVTPTAANAATVQANGVVPVVNITAAALTIGDTNPPDSDQVTVYGTAGNDAITVARGATTTVTVNALLPVAVTTADTTALLIGTGGGTDGVTVSGSAGPAVLSIQGGQGPASDSLTVNNTATASNTTVTPGATNDAGTVANADGTIQFAGMRSVQVNDNALSTTDTLIVNDANGNSTVTTAHPGGSNLVWVNNQAVVSFSNFNQLTLNARFGNDSFNVSPVGMTLVGANPTINVNGTASTTDTLTVSGSAAADTVAYNPGAATPNLVIIGAPVVNLGIGVTALTYNGQGGNDLLTLNTPAGSTTVYNPGNTPDAGSVQVNSLVPLSFTSLGNGGQAVNLAGGAASSLLYNGTAASNVFTATGLTGPTRGQVQLQINGVNQLPIVTTASVTSLTLNGVAGNNTFNVAGGLPYATTTVAGVAVANLTNPIGAIVVNLADSVLNTNTTITGYGGTVTLIGVVTANLNTNGNGLLVNGTSLSDNITYTPTSASAGTFTDAGLATVFNFTSDTSTFTISGIANQVTVNGTAGNDAITVARGATTTVTVNALLPVGVTTADTTSLLLGTGGGIDTITVSGSAGPAVLSVQGGQVPAGDSLTVNNTATSGNTTVTPGATNDSGTLANSDGTISFSGMTSVHVNDNGTVTTDVLTIRGTDGNDAITAAHPGSNNIVWVNAQAVIVFNGNFNQLTLDGRFGNDAFAVSPAGMTFIGATPQINVADVTLGTGTLQVNGGTSAAMIGYLPTGPAAGSVTESTAAAAVVFANVPVVTINGQNAGDALTVTSPTASTVTLNPGAALDAGGLVVGSLAPLSFTNLGATGSVAIADTSATRVDSLIYNGTPANDSFTVDAGTGTVHLNSQIPVLTPGVNLLTLNGLAGNNTYTISATAGGPQPYTTINVNGSGNGTPGPDVLNLNGNGVTTATANLGTPTPTVTGAGLGTVAVSGVGTVNLSNSTAAITAAGTTGQAAAFSVTPTTATMAALQANGVVPMLNATTTGTLTVDPGTGSGNQVTVNGTAAADAIAVVRGALGDTVTVNALKTITVNSADTSNLVVASGLGADTTTVSGAGLATEILTVQGGQSPAGDSLTVNNTSASGNTTVTPGATNDAGTVANADGTISFSGVTSVHVNDNGTVTTDVLTIRGTDGNDAITAAHLGSNNIVWVNAQAVVVFNGNFNQLTLDGRFGNDAFAVSPAGMTFIGATAQINVADVTLGAGTLQVNGGTSAAMIGYLPTGPAAGSVTESTAAAAVVFANVPVVTINGQNAGDALTVTSPTASTVTLNPGAAVDAGGLVIGSLAPLSFTNLGATGSVAFADTSATRVDSLIYNGTPANDSFTVDAGTGTVHLNSQIPVLTPGVSVLTLNGLAGNDTFNVAGGLPYTTTTVAGNAVANLTNPIGNITVNLADSVLNTNTTITGYGGTVTLIGVVTANLSANGNGLLVNGTSRNDNTTYTPTGASAGTFTNTGLATVFNFTGDTSTFTISGQGNTANQVTVDAPAGRASVREVNRVVTVLPIGSPAPLEPVTLAVDVQIVNLMGGGGPDTFGITPAAGLQYVSDGNLDNLVVNVSNTGGSSALVIESATGGPLAPNQSVVLNHGQTPDNGIARTFTAGVEWPDINYTNMPTVLTNGPAIPGQTGVSASETGTTVTITTPSPNGLQVGYSVMISGFTGPAAGYNGTWVITSILSPTMFTYADPVMGLPPATGGTEVPVVASQVDTAGPHINGVAISGQTSAGVNVLSASGSLTPSGQTGLSATALGTTVTITTPTPHGLLAGTGVSVAGFTGMNNAAAPYNGTWVITSVPTPTTFTYTVSVNNLPAATGGIEVPSPGQTGVSASETGTTVTVATPSAHGLQVGNTVSIGGFTGTKAGYNGTFVVTGVPTPTTFTYTDSATALPSATAGSEVVINTDVTITTPSAHGLQQGDSVTIGGFTGAAAGYNGTWVVTGSLTPTTFTYTNPATNLPTSATGGSEVPVFSLFALTPQSFTQGPTPLINSLTISVVDPGQVGLDPFADVNPGLYTVVGDQTGIAPVSQVIVTNTPVVTGQPATATVQLFFAQSLLDDRYTLTINKNLVDQAGNQLAGTSNASEPIGPPTFPSGHDGLPADFVARFTVNSRPHIGVDSSTEAGSSQQQLDINGNGFFDPVNAADAVNSDKAFSFGLSNDTVFSGNFAPAGQSGTGYDELAAYGQVNNQWRWLLTFNNVAQPDYSVVSNLQQNWQPVVGRFNPAINADEIGLFDGNGHWYIDFNHTNNVGGSSTVLVSDGLVGTAVVGDFDGSGHIEFATYQASKQLWTFDLTPFATTHTIITLQMGFNDNDEANIPVAADMNGDGVTDIGLYVPPDSDGPTSGNPAGWYWLVSQGTPVVGTINTLAHPFNPSPFSNDLYYTFGSGAQSALIGHWDPPLTNGLAGPTGTPLEVVANRGQLVAEGGGVTISSTTLRVTDPVHANVPVTYTVTALPTDGELLLSGKPATVGTTFTQRDINLGHLRYQHDGSETVADSFAVTAADSSGGTLAPTTVAIKVKPVNDAPTLNGNGTALTSIPEDTRQSAGDLVSAIVGDTITDPDSGALVGIAIIGATGGHGTWQYSTNGGTTWSAFEVVSASQALLLPDTDRVRFVPAANFNGLVSLTYRAWDQTSGKAGAKANLSSSASVGGSKAFSAAKATASLTVMPVNDAPTLVANSHPVVRGGEWGTTASALLAAARAHDVDATAVFGIAVTATTGDGWEYSTDGGTTWLELGVMAASGVRLLDETARLRRAPGSTGPATLTFRAWDGTQGVAGETADLSAADSVGGRTAFSTVSVTAVWKP